MLIHFCTNAGAESHAVQLLLSEEQTVLERALEGVKESLDDGTNPT